MSDHPNPPWRVLVMLGGSGPVFWVDWHPSPRWFAGYCDNQPFSFEPWQLTVVAHSHNDPEAVEIIRKAKGE